MGNLIEKHFGKMGARARVRDMDPVRGRRLRRPVGEPSPIRLDVAQDREGEYFDIQVDAKRVSLEVLDVRPQQRHLLLMSRNVRDGGKEKFLCGHDERAWFVAAVPGRSASNVATAFEALKPVAVRTEQVRRGVRHKHRARRHTAAYIRQGEWFFVPSAGMAPADALVLRNEPLRRGGGKPHIAEYCFRTGGENVYVSSRFPNGISFESYQALIKRKPKARMWGWQVMRRDAGVYVRGRVRHADHKTICLVGWHRVLMNTEADAPSMRHVAFLD